MLKKLKPTIAILFLALALSGCSSKSQSKATSPNSGTNQLPSGHPPITSQSGTVSSKYTQSQVESIVSSVLKHYPGDWKLSGSTLTKGNYVENKNYKIADEIGKTINGAMVSIFIGDNATRISSTVRMNDLTAYPSPPEAAQAIKEGRAVSSEASGMGGSGNYLKVFIPIQSGNKTIGCIMVDVPQA